MFITQSNSVLVMAQNFTQLTKPTVEARYKQLWDWPAAETNQHTKRAAMMLFCSTHCIQIFPATIWNFRESIKNNIWYPPNPSTQKANDLIPYSNFSAASFCSANMMLGAINRTIQDNCLPSVSSAKSSMQQQLLSITVSLLPNWPWAQGSKNDNDLIPYYIFSAACFCSANNDQPELGPIKRTIQENCLASVISAKQLLYITVSLLPSWTWT